MTCNPERCVTCGEPRENLPQGWGGWYWRHDANQDHPFNPSAESGERQYPEWDSGGHCHSCGGWSVPEPGDRIPIDTVSDGKGHLQDCPWNTTPAIAPAPADDPLAAALEVLEDVVQPSDVVQSRIAAIQLSVRLAPVALRELMAWRACADDPFEDLDTLDAFRAHANELGVALDEARAATDRALLAEKELGR